MKELIPIGEVCKLVGTTSRTLRFYEEQGIISSTNGLQFKQRQYSNEQLAHLKNVFVLRNLGLSIKSIKGLLCENINLSTAILEKRHY